MKPLPVYPWDAALGLDRVPDLSEARSYLPQLPGRSLSAYLLRISLIALTRICLLGESFEWETSADAGLRVRTFGQFPACKSTPGWCKLRTHEQLALLIANAGAVYPGDSLPLSPLSEPKFTNRPDSALRLCSLLYHIFLAFAVTDFMTSAVGECSGTLVLLCGCEQRLSRDLSALLVIILLSAVHLSVLAVFLGRESTSRLSRLIN